MTFALFLDFIPYWLSFSRGDLGGIRLSLASTNRDHMFANRPPSRWSSLENQHSRNNSDARDQVHRLVKLGLVDAQPRANVKKKRGIEISMNLHSQSSKSKKVRDRERRLANETVHCFRFDRESVLQSKDRPIELRVKH